MMHYVMHEDGVTRWLTTASSRLTPTLRVRLRRGLHPLSGVRHAEEGERHKWCGGIQLIHKAMTSREAVQS